MRKRPICRNRRYLWFWSGGILAGNQTAFAEQQILSNENIDNPLRVKNFILCSMHPDGSGVHA